MNNDKFKKVLLIIAIILSLLSFIAIFISFVISGKTDSLFKASLPLSLLFLNIFLYKKMFPKK